MAKSANGKHIMLLMGCGNSVADESQLKADLEAYMKTDFSTETKTKYLILLLKVKNHHQRVQYKITFVPV